MSSSRRQQRWATAAHVAAAVLVAPLLVPLIAAPAALAATDLYVDASVVASGNGGSWGQAFAELQEALDVATDGTTVHAAEGTYLPDYDVSGGTHTGDIDATFLLVDGVDLRGGYPAGGASPSQIDPVAHPVILSGDLDADDAPGPTNRDDNARHVVFVVGTSEIVGATISGGNAFGPDTADRGGAGLRTDGATLLLDRVVVTDNHADGAGGGLYAFGNVSTTLVNSDLIANTGANGGGAFFSGGTATVVNSRILGNSGCVDCTVGINGGGLTFSGTGLVSNSLISGNTAYRGAGIRAWFAPVTILSSTLVNNASTLGSGIEATDNGETLTVRNSILWGNGAGGFGEYGKFGTVDVTYSVIPETAGTGNISADPLYLDEDGADDVPGTIDDDVRLWPDSPAIDAGNNADIPADTHDVDGDADVAEDHPLTVDGSPRRLDYTDADDTGAGTAPIVDIGAVEMADPIPNRAPVAAHDVATAAAGQPVTIDVLANDTDPDGDDLTVELLGTLQGPSSWPAAATQVLPDQQVRFTSDPSFEGVDMVHYKALDRAVDDEPLAGYADAVVAVGDVVAGQQAELIDDVVATGTTVTASLPLHASVRVGTVGPVAVSVTGLHGVDPVDPGPLTGYTVLEREVALYLPTVVDGGHRLVLTVHDSLLPPNITPSWDTIVTSKNGAVAPTCGDSGGAAPCVALITDHDGYFVIEIEDDPYGLGTEQANVSSWNIGAAPEGRQSGDTRVETAVELSRSVYASSDIVLLARADQFADALAGGPLARKLAGPLLLTYSSQLHPSVATEIARLGADHVILLGGTGALSDQVITDLRAQGIATVERIAGADRFETAALIGRRVGGTQAYIALGRHAVESSAWPDALAVAGLAAFQARPLLLTSGNALPTATREALQDLAVGQATVVGGAAAISSLVESQISSLGIAVDRLAGSSRYGTSASIADRAVAAGMDARIVWVTSGRNWPDALAAAPGSSAVGSILLLVDPHDLSRSPETRNWVSSHAEVIDDVLVIGGSAAVSPEVEQALRAVL